MLARTALVLPLLAAILPAQAAEPVDEQAVAILRKHGLEQSQVMDHLSWICDVHGPRLTGSPNMRRAQEWAVQTLKDWGLASARTEEWGPFGRGWQLDRFSLHVTGNNPWPVLAWPKAWSPSVAPIEAEVVAVGGLTADQLEALDLTGKIVLIEAPREVSEPFDSPARRLDAGDLLGLADGNERGASATPGRRRSRDDFRRDFQRQRAVQRAVFRKRPLAILDRASKGDYGTVFVQGASALSEDEGEDAPGQRRRGPGAYDPGAEVIPQITLAVEHYNRIARLLDKKVPVRVALDLQSTYFDGDNMERNVIAELPGSDPRLRDEVVMFGAHFDSWHAGTGATDNGCGSAVMLEAMRLVTQLARETGQGPRRTIRIGLWSGEEQGLRGSRAYVAQHFATRGDDGELQPTPAHARLSAYYNLDNGTGRIRGVFLQGNEAIAPIFRAWLRPFHDLDAATLTLEDTGGTDHLAFDAVGLPGFQFIQDPAAYSTRTHHSNMDNWDHAIAADLRQAATIIASFAWHTAQRDALLPRKPPPAAQPADAAGRRRGG
jgi:hypothetical protein